MAGNAKPVFGARMRTSRTPRYAGALAATYECARSAAWLRRGWFLLLLLLSLSLTFPVAHAQDQPTNYGPPYTFNYFGGSGTTPTFTPALTLDAAIQTAGAALTAKYGSNVTVQKSVFQNGNVVVITIQCRLYTKYYDPTRLQYVARVAYTQDDGGTDCFDKHALVLIYPTIQSYDIGKNRGGCDTCDSGDGHKGGVAPGSPLKSDPINTATGNKFEQVTDYESTSPWLTFRRFYNSNTADGYGAMGALWRHSFDRALQIVSSSVINLYRPDGRSMRFTRQTSGAWTSSGDVANTLTEQDQANGQPSGYTVVVAATRQVERYSPTGQLLSITDPSGVSSVLTYSTASTPASVAPLPNLLLSVTDPYGRSLNFAYDSQARLSTVGLPDGGNLTYGYGSTSNLASVKYADGKLRQYVYDEASQNGGAKRTGLLTGVIDENSVRYETTRYDSQARAVAAGKAGGVETTTMTYYGNGQTQVLTPLGVATLLSFQNALGALKVSGSSQACGVQCNQPWKSQAYDTNGYPSSFTDFNNNTTATTYNSAGLPTQTIEAQGLAMQRTTNTTWDLTLRVPLTRTVLDNKGATVAMASWVYNAAGQTAARCEADPSVPAAAAYACSASGAVPDGVRRWTYAYCAAVDANQCPLPGLLLSETGPRSDVAQTTSYRYYLADSATAHHGDLQSITDAMGRTVTFNSYDGAGRVTRMTDANGVITDYAYHPRGWLQTRTVRANADGTPSANDAVTQLGYSAYGAVTSVKDPDGVQVTYTYDDAHRLTDITDAIGNRIHYTLDAAGNKTKEETFDAGNTLRRSLARSFNTLGQLTGIKDGFSRTVFDASFTDSYDANGNRVRTADALGIQRKQGYDALNRLISTIDNYNGTDAATKNTQSVLVYGARDELQGVSDPDGLNTTYDYDGLGNAKALHSPDTGTSSYLYDVAGNRTQATDARGVVSHSAFDALNRITATTYPTSDANVSYRYDEANSVTGCAGSYPVGRLTSVVETAVTTVYCYDVRGNVVQKRQTQGTNVDTVSYSYTLADRLASTRTPDGTAIQYGRDGAGRINGVTAQPPGSSSVGNVVTNVSYLPFGPIASYTLGNGQTLTRTYDANYAVTDVVSPALNLHFARDAMGNITALGNAAGANPAIETYSYDPLYRLTGLKDAQGQAIEAYTYNKTGDRLSKASNGVATGTYGYQTGTHRLTSIGSSARTYDANGNTTGNATGGDTFGYGYNDRNRMTVVQRNGQTVGSYTYNAMEQRVAKVAAANQRFAYDESSQLLGEYGTTSRSYVRLGDLPVAVVDTSGAASTMSYVHADGLGAPRVITDGTGSAVWQWGYQVNLFGEKAPSMAGMAFNLRFPGQYYDVESDLAYNVNRDYEAATGRYVQSDPLGLFGGQPGTYSYTDSNPLLHVDPFGLEDLVLEPIHDKAYPYDSRYTNPKHFTVGTHGGDTNRDTVLGPDPSYQQQLTVADVGDAILQKMPQINKTIELDICYAGRGGEDSFAAKLAKYLAKRTNSPVHVIASSDEVAVGYNTIFGRPVGKGYADPGPGGWIHYSADPPPPN